MSKKIVQASVRVPEIPRVRFFSKSRGGASSMQDVTCDVASLAIEDLDDGHGRHALLRLDNSGSLVWRTLHLSLQEAKWQAKFEYDLPENEWREYS